MPEHDRAASRRMIGLAMGGAAALLVLVAVLVLAGIIPVAETSRMLVGGVLAGVGAIDLLLAFYFFVSDQP